MNDTSELCSTDLYHFPLLYSTDSKGKIRQWGVSVDGNEMVVQHGALDGKIQEKRTTCKAKNVGKSNATTPAEQAMVQAKAKWVFQMHREDYHYLISHANQQIRPMLAMDYLKVPHRVNWNTVVSQPKLDGVRLTVGRRYRDREAHEFMTRKGEVYKLPHLGSQTTELLTIINQLCDNRCLALDGEAYIHGMPLQNIMSLVTKYHEKESSKIQYWLFDLIIPDMKFIDRYEILAKAFSQMKNSNFYQLDDHDRIASTNDEIHDEIGMMKLIRHNIIESESDMKIVHSKYAAQGYEGLMIRHGDGMYGIAKRSADLFKYKKFFTEEARITDVWEDNNGNAMFTCIQKNDMVCKVTPKRSHDDRKQMLIDRLDYIGQWISVKYQSKTEDGIFQFPVGLAIRKCDDEGNPLI